MHVVDDVKGEKDMQNAEQMREVMRYMGWLMFNGFDNEEQRELEDRIPINGVITTAKRGVALLVQGFEREESDWV